MVMVCPALQTIIMMPVQGSPSTVKPSSLVMSLHVVETSQSGEWMYNLEEGLMICYIPLTWRCSYLDFMWKKLKMQITKVSMC